MRSLRIRAALALVLAAILLAAGLAAASADEEPEQSDASLTILEPGNNFIGWVGSSFSVTRLKSQFPDVEAVRAWDALKQQVYEPTNLDSGMGVWITLTGDQAVEWRRPMVPVKGKVELRRGRNLVAWLGPDDWPIERVVSGIGRSLNRAEWGGVAFDPSLSQDTESMPLIRRGDALWIDVSRTVNWLQPAGVMPTIKFAGEASADLKSLVRRDSVDVMNYYAEEFGLQPDGSILTVYIAASLDSLLDQFKLDGLSTDGVPKLWYDAGGWASSDGHIVLKLEQWEPDYGSNAHGLFGEYTAGRGVMAHEYYHTIQQQTSSTNAATWLVEGGADWARAGIRRRDAESSIDEELAGNRRMIASGDAPPLDHTERRVESWQYTLGALASHQLALRSGEQSLLEFWRALLPEPLGPLGRWQSKPPWQSVFENVFGLAVDDFYVQFASWRGNLAPLAIRGQVIGPNGGGLPYVKVVGYSERLEDDGHDYSDTYTDGDGSFSIAASGLGYMKIGVDLGGCTVYYHSSGMVFGLNSAELLEGVATDSQILQVNISNQMCVWRISGGIDDQGGVSRQGGWVHAQATDAGRSAQIDADGSFVITVPTNGSYRLSMNLDGCSVYFRNDGAVGTWQNASQVRIVDSDAEGISFVLPDGVCTSSISGVLLDADGNAIADTWIQAHGDDANGGGRTDSDGRFAITLSSAGEYRLSFSIDGCWVYYRRAVATTKQDSATLIAVSESGVKDVKFKLPVGACATKIAGRLLDSEGNGIADTWVFANKDGGNASAQTDGDGSYSITVPATGSYRVSTRIDGCNVYYRRNGVTGRRDRATQIRVRDESIEGIELQIPDDMCIYRISGRLLNADGSPRSNQWLTASSRVGWGGAQTGPDGSFDFAVPGTSSYRVSVWVDGCSIYIRQPRTGKDMEQRAARSSCHGRTQPASSSVCRRIPQTSVIEGVLDCSTYIRDHSDPSQEMSVPLRRLERPEVVESRRPTI